MRVLAHMCGDDAMCRLFNRDSGDVYKLLAAHVFGLPPDAVSSEQRKQAKTAS